MRRRRNIESQLPQKVNRLLGGILVFLLLIGVRVWHLSVVQHEERLEEAKRPQERVVIERGERASIQDRFGIPLALNKVQYDISICYGPIREVPRIQWQRDEIGKRVKHYARKTYITELSSLLANLLHLDADDVEDLIHAKAAILGNVPCLLKADIPEESYFRLKMLEQEWPGIVAQIAPRRHYPLGKVGGEVVGYIAPISQKEYRGVLQQMQQLREEERFDELEELEKRAYSIHDLTGKMGVEAAFDAQLRGMCGKKRYLTDTRGNHLRVLGGEEATPGKPVSLALSSELQEFAENLLIEYEQEAPSNRPFQVKRRALLPPHQPWIKGGAIVVMKPQTGEVLALASHPRLDPNLFIQRSEKVSYLLETERALEKMWDFSFPLTRERFDLMSGSYRDEELLIDWKEYLSLILPANSPVIAQLDAFSSVQVAIEIQSCVEQLLALFDSTIAPTKIFDLIYEGHASGCTIAERDALAHRLPEVRDEVEAFQKLLAPYFAPLTTSYEKLLLVDLYRLAVDSSRFTSDLFPLLGSLSLSDYRACGGHLIPVMEVVKGIVRPLFHEKTFKGWRTEHFKAFLADKRKEERLAKKRYARPYVDFLEEKERELFSHFWETHKWSFLSLFLRGEGEAPYADELKAWAHDLAGGAYPAVDWRRHYDALQKYLAPFSTALLPIYLETMRSYRELERPLLGRYSGLRGQKERDLAAAFYPRYGYGIARSHAYRQATVIGSIFKLVPAYEALRQKYFRQLEAGKSVSDLNPLVMIDDKRQVAGKGWQVGLNEKGGAIPLYYKGGRLPRSEHAQVGRIDLVAAIERSSNPYFSLLAGDVLDDPEDLIRAANLLGYGEKSALSLPGEYGGLLPDDVAYERTGLYSFAIGQHTLVGTPLQTAVMLSTLANGGKVMRPKIALQEEDEVRWEIFLPQEIQNVLIEGMRKVVMGEKGTARFMRGLFPHSLCERLIGKTSTAEVIERYGLDREHGHLKAKEIWFGGILYADREHQEPDIAIVVYLKEGVFGRHAAPLAFKIAQKWEALSAECTRGIAEVEQ